MMEDDFLNNDYEDMDGLLHKYEAIKNGNSTSLLDEDDFEAVIDYFYQNNNESEALLACEIARTYYPFSSAILFFKAQILTHAQKYGQALKVLDEMEQFEQGNVDAIILRSDILLGQLKYDQAAQWLEEQSNLLSGKEKVIILLELADVYDECEEFEAVFETLKRIIKIDKRNDEALQKLSFWADFSDKLEESVTIHEALTDEDPYNTIAWFNLGAAYQGLKMYEKAIDAYEYCIAIDENFEFAYRNMADAFMRLKKYDKALEVLGKHLEIAKPEDAIFEAMGFCYEKKKNYQQARFCYRQASQLNPKDDSIFFKIGETYAQEKQWEKAIKSFNVAFSLDKENASYALAIGHCLMELGAAKEAIVSYLNAVTLKPGSKTMWIALLRGLYYVEFYDDLITQIEAARSFCGDKTEFTYYEAAALMELGKTKEALIKLEDALQQMPTRSKIFTELNPEFLKRTAVVELIGKYKKNKSK